MMPNHQYTNHYGNSASADAIIQPTIRLISIHGYQHVTLSLICSTVNCSKSTIISKFGELQNILQRSLLACLEDFMVNLRRQFKLNDMAINSLMDIWHQLNLYNFNHQNEANVLVQYFRYPSITTIPDLKARLNVLYAQVFDKTESKLSEKSNAQVRFLAFMALYQSANHFIQKECKSSFTDVNEKEYFNNHVATEIQKILALPFF